MDLNTASVDELAGIAMIGREKAQAIVDWREDKGPFKSIEDLKHVPGFSDKLTEGMSVYCEIGEEEGGGGRGKGGNALRKAAEEAEENEGRGGKTRRA